MTGVSVAIGRCYIHGGDFTFDPGRVPSVSVDPQTGRPPDVDADGNAAEPEPGAVERSVKQPICPPCAKRVNEARGNRLFTEDDTAAALAREELR